MGLFSAEKVAVRSGTLLDTVCARLEVLMKYEPGERDLVMLQQTFVVEWKDGREVRPMPFLLSSIHFLDPTDGTVPHIIGDNHRDS
jgi:hypothetical protein